MVVTISPDTPIATKVLWCSIQRYSGRHFYHFFIRAHKETPSSHLMTSGLYTKSFRHLSSGYCYANAALNPEDEAAIVVDMRAWDADCRGRASILFRCFYHPAPAIVEGRIVISRSASNKETVTLFAPHKIEMPAHSIIHDLAQREPIVLVPSSPKAAEALKIAHFIASNGVSKLTAVDFLEFINYRDKNRSTIAAGPEGAFMKKPAETGLVRTIVWCKNGSATTFNIVFNKKKLGDKGIAKSVFKTITTALDVASLQLVASATVRTVYVDFCHEHRVPEASLDEEFTLQNAIVSPHILHVGYRISYPNKYNVIKKRFFMLLGETSLDSCHTLSLAAKRPLVLAMVEAIVHCHRADIVHRDIKPSNYILVGGVVKLIDFGGAARLLDEERLKRWATPRLCSSPEELARKKSGLALPLAARKPADIWSLGITMSAMYTGVYPGEDTEVYEDVIIALTPHWFRKWVTDRELTVSEPTLDLLDRMLNPDYKLRPTAEECHSRLHACTTL